METETPGGTERVVLVTGGGTGIGRAVAAEFCRDSHVVVLGRREDRLVRAVEELGPAAAYQRADVCRREDVEQAVRRIVDRHGRIDVVVNNAGLNRPVSTRLPLGEGERSWDEVLATNLKGAFLVSVAAAPHLPRPGGRIVNISSVASFTGGRVPGGLAYAASKAGLLGLTYGLAAELGPEGITVNAVAPGLIAGTERTDRWPPERRRSFVANTPAGRAGSPTDVAAVVRFLASPEASFLTGAVIPADGGWLVGRGSFLPDAPDSATS